MKIPTPLDAVRLAEQGTQAIQDAVALVPRLVGIVGQVEQLMSRVESLVAGVEQVQQRAARTVAATESLLSRVDPILTGYEESLTRLAPVVQRLAETTDPAEVDALVKLVDQLPQIVDRVDADILPILTTFDSVAPDLRELLDTSKELNEIISSIPGLGRKRSEEARERSREEAGK